MRHLSGAADPLNFSPTTVPSSWQAATNVGGVDGDVASFPTTGFAPAVPIDARTGWIANNSTGTNGGLGDWTFFVFRQTFDLTGYIPSTANLQFQWAADDSGQVFATRGSWTPKYRLNGGALVPGTWPGGESYAFGPTTSITSGFVSGQNVLDFYVEGNGVTDGFALETVSFTAQTVPEPSTGTMLLVGLALLGGEMETGINLPRRKV